jgi:hypothetical protein
MKVLKTLLLMGLVGIFSFQGQSQNLSKAEKKALKKEIKGYKKHPVSFKAMKERNKKDIRERDETIEALTSQLDAVNAKNKSIKDSLNQLVSSYQTLMTKQQALGEIPIGTVYAVQIGYFTELNLESFNNQIRSIKAENVEGAKRYIIGYFSDLSGAVQFGEDIKKIGIDDAFVSQYINGERNMSFDALNIK